MPPSEIIATSLVPPPTSTTMRPIGSAISSPAPIAAARDSSIRWTSRAPALRDASSIARRSTSVIPDGAHMTTVGRLKRLRTTLARNWRSIASVTSKSAITPWRSGRSAEMLAGVRPIICWASWPTACTSPVRWSIATTDGSDMTMPRPRTNTTVFAVPRSMATSPSERRDQRRRRRAAIAMQATRSGRRRPPDSGQQRLGEVVGVERPQVLERLADPDQLDRDAELVGDRQRDPALGGPVELGQDDAGDVDRLPEQLRLAQAVLPRGGVHGHQRLVRRLGQLLGDDAADLGQLLHQVVLRVQAPGRVDDDHVGADLAAAGDRVEGDRARVGVLPALHEGHVRAPGPLLELLDGGGPEGVRRADHDRL